MTALKKYERLESGGRWRDGPEAAPREVLVSFGDASLVISDSSGPPLTHWSLAAVRRVNPKAHPAVFSPDTAELETLEVSDETMIEAIETVRRGIARGRPRHGRLRMGLTLGAVALVVALAVFWLPGALARHTARTVPASTEAQIGAQLLQRLARASGPVCDGVAGRAALDQLMAALPPDSLARAVVISGGIAEATHLPGGVVVLGKSLLDRIEDPEALAGYILAERTQAAAEPSLQALLVSLGPVASLRLLTSGQMRATDLDTHAEALRYAPRPVVDEDALLARFEAAHISSRAYAFARDGSGETTLGLIEADPMRGKDRPPLISDSDWIRLQGICD